jgi:DNA-3-methyladenine glycosylase
MKDGMAKYPLILAEKFYRRDTETVARELLGCVLVHETSGGKRVSGRIVETEAYLGLTDRAAHTFGDRRTPRTRSMYLEGGHAYVYFVYGMHFCFNVVTRTAEHPEAVLIRALDPLEGIELMHKRRKVKREVDLTNGPAKLRRALAIDRSHDGLSLVSSSLYIEKGPQVRESRMIECSPRIGVAYAEDAADWPLRFSIKGNVFVSKAP